MPSPVRRVQGEILRTTFQRAKKFPGYPHMKTLILAFLVSIATAEWLKLSKVNFAVFKQETSLITGGGGSVDYV